MSSTRSIAREAQCARSGAAPIGVFDSGYGGLTVLAEIAARMPGESTVFVGDSAHFPYGPKSQQEVRDYALGICSHLAQRGCKLIVIACNTATAAGLKDAQMAFDVPVVGVVEPGARAAVHMTRNRRVGVIATQGTVDADAYPRAIHNLDAGVEVFSAAAPQFVDMAEAGIQFRALPDDERLSASQQASMVVSDRGVLDVDSGEMYMGIAEGYLAPLRDARVDTLVLGCTHFPLIEPLVQHAMGKHVALVSSAEETAREVQEVLGRRGQLAPEGSVAVREFYTTGESVAEFERFGRIVMGDSLGSVDRLALWG